MEKEMKPFKNYWDREYANESDQYYSQLIELNENVSKTINKFLKQGQQKGNLKTIEYAGFHMEGWNPAGFGEIRWADKKRKLTKWINIQPEYTENNLLNFLKVQGHVYVSEEEFSNDGGKINKQYDLISPKHIMDISDGPVKNKTLLHCIEASYADIKNADRKDLSLTYARKYPKDFDFYTNRNAVTLFSRSGEE